MKEGLLIALRDFVAFNPHYDLKKPIKVKKGSIIIVDGGIPKDCLISKTYDNVMSLFSSDTEKGFKDILNICTANNIEVYDFRLVRNTKAFKNEILLANGVNFPLFYWFDNFKNVPFSECDFNKDYHIVSTVDIFGEPFDVVVTITNKDKIVINDDNHLIMIIGDE